MRKEVNYFGNLINEQVKQGTIAEFLKVAIPQKHYKDSQFQVYLLGNEIAVGRISSKTDKIIRYCILGDRETYRQLYTNSRNNEDIFRQALYHGACILTNRNGKSIGLGYDL